MQEAAKATQGSLFQEQRVYAVRRQPQATFPSSKRRNKPALAAEASDSGQTCSRCGYKYHTGASCPAENQKCRACGQLGHFARVCKARNGHKVGLIRLHQMTCSMDWDMVPVTAKLDGVDKPVIMDWLPDTGSDVNAVSKDHLEMLSGSIESVRSSKTKVTDASGTAMKCLGTTPVMLSIGETTSGTNLHVFEKLESPILSRQALKELGLLPPAWPRCGSINETPSCKLMESGAAADQPFKKEPTSIVAQCADLPLKEEPNPSVAQGMSVRPARAVLPDAEADRRAIMEEFKDVFDDSQLRPMKGPPMKIKIKPNAKPYKVNGARPIPYAYRDRIKEQLDAMVRDGIIEEVSEPCEWCHPIVLVPKRNTEEMRMTVDFKKLNNQVERPVHPARTPRDAVGEVTGAQYFTTFDARHGYWQVPLDEESKALTTFITKWGRYRYLRDPQGFIAAGDEFNHRTDAAFAGIAHVAKVVDDGLIYDMDYQQHISRVRAVLQKAREHSITLSPKKFIFAQPQVEFCGYQVGRDGWSMPESKLSALAKFPEPTNKTELRSFMGLVNQFGEFSSSIAECANPLRGLLKARVEYVWLPEHASAFENVKKALTSTPTLAYFQFDAKTKLETDASRTKGLGYALWQLQEDTWRLIQCGSRFLSDTETRYAMIELELLAVVWAAQKCKPYLSGKSFELVIDHRPLVPILDSYTLDQIENPRLQRLVMKLQMFQFSTTWRQGKQHAVADALSRAPVDSPEDHDQLGEDGIISPTLKICRIQEDDGRVILPDIKLTVVREAASRDADYQKLITQVQNGFPNDKCCLSQDLKRYWNVREHLSVDDELVLKGQRLVVPVSLRREVLRDLHASHQGVERTRRRARQTVYWPGIDEDIVTLVKNCQQCQEHQASQTKEPILSEPVPSLPFQNASADLFSFAGFQYLVYVDRLSGWPCVGKLGRTANSNDVICFLRSQFPSVGVPQKIVTDGGPQFSSHKFKKFCQRWRIHHEKSSPHYHQANGHAESSVKAVKYLLAKTTTSGDLDVESFQRGLLEWRNTPRADGRSPAQILYGRSLPSFVFAHHKAFSPEWKVAADKADDKRERIQQRVVAQYNKTARCLKPLRLGDHVNIQDQETNRWTKKGVIVAIGRRRDYYVKLPSGRVYWRNRRFLRQHIPCFPAINTSRDIDNETTCLPQQGHAQPETGNCRETECKGTIGANETSYLQPSGQTEDATSLVMADPKSGQRVGTRRRCAPDRFNITSTKGQSYY